jgi:branched-chain amino acid transport system permease protein
MTTGIRLPSGPWAFAAFAVVLVGVPLFAPQFWVTIGNYIGLYSLVALGLVVLTGVAGQTSFGQAAFVGIGAYTTAILSTRYAMSPWINLAVALAITVLVALFLGFITLRMKGHYLPLATIAWGMSLYLLFGNVDFLGGHTGLTGIPALNLFGLELRNERYFFFLIWGITLAALAGTDNLLDSRPGRAIRALKGQREMAESFGVDPGTLNIIVFVYAALLACVRAGCTRTCNASSIRRRLESTRASNTCSWRSSAVQAAPGARSSARA